MQPGLSASETRGRRCHNDKAVPDFAALNTGYALLKGTIPRKKGPHPTRPVLVLFGL